MYIRRISTTLLSTHISVRMPEERPAVANADAASNDIFRKFTQIEKSLYWLYKGRMDDCGIPQDDLLSIKSENPLSTGAASDSLIFTRIIFVFTAGI